MKLVDEIEAPIGDVQSPADLHAAITRKYIRESPWWPRIRAALLAGEEMASGIELRVKEEFLLPDGEMDHCARRFRAATEGTDAAAIGRAS